VAATACRIPRLRDDHGTVSGRSLDERSSLGEHSVPPVAARQAGVFTPAQAVAAGLTPRQVRRRIDHGHWYHVAGRGFTAVTASGWSPPMLAWAAWLTWPDGVIGYRVAAAFHGFPVAAGTDVEVLLPLSRRPFRGLVSHDVPYLSTDVALFPGGLRITSPIRTAVDCLAVLDTDEAWSLFAWLVTHRRLDRAHLTNHLGRHTGRPGTRQLRALHTAGASGAVSLPEQRFHQLLRRAGISGWTAGARLVDADGLIGVVDVLLDGWIVIEIDGYGPHNTRQAFVADRRRQNRLVLAGYHVVRFTWWDLVDHPDDVIRTVQALRRTRT
jgi:hypothetical protein